MVIDAIWMFEFSKETNLLEDVLPLFQGLFATIRHLFDSHDLVGDVIACIIYRSEAAMANFTEVVKQLLRIFGLEQCCNIWIFKAARPEKKNENQRFYMILFIFS